MKFLPMALLMQKTSPTPYDKVTLKTVRGIYQTFTGKEFAKRATENGIAVTICCFIKIKCVNSLATISKKSVRVSVLFNL